MPKTIKRRKETLRDSISKKFVQQKNYEQSNISRKINT